MGVQGRTAGAFVVKSRGCRGERGAAPWQAREEAATHDEARQSQMSELSRELTISTAYSRTLRSAKDRAGAACHGRYYRHARYDR